MLRPYLVLCALYLMVGISTEGISVCEFPPSTSAC